MVSDASYVELHEFAAAQGIPRRGFEGDHYDVPQDRYAALVSAGARPVGGGDLARILRDSGLRIQKRTRERVVATVPDAAWLPPGSRADVISSRQESAPANTVVVRLALRRAGDVLVLERLDGLGPDLPAAPGAGLTPPEALDRLYRVVLGAPVPPTTMLLGYVRNTVPRAADGYPWPVPQAAFAVWTDEVGASTRPLAGRWLPAARLADELVERHWWPLLDPALAVHG
jgi:hypothetical protein